METIKYNIFNIGTDMCRIETSDCRSIYRKISDGACICSLSIMLLEMERITKEVEALGNEVIFRFINTD